jgi:hypothetical protein
MSKVFARIITSAEGTTFVVFASSSVCATLQLDERSLWQAEGLAIAPFSRRGAWLSGSREAMSSLASHALARGSGGWDLPPSTIRACVQFGKRVRDLLEKNP